MGGVFGNPEEKEFNYCSDNRRTCAQCIANNVIVGPPAFSILFQLLRLSTAFNSPTFNELTLELNLREQFVTTVKCSLPAVGEERRLWILHYSPIIFVVSEKDRRKSFAIVDRTALYIFAEPTGCCAGCASNNFSNYTQLRIPLTYISRIICEGDCDFIITAQLRMQGPNILGWASHQTVQERVIRFHSTRRGELLKIMRKLMNVLSYGEPGKCQWLNMPREVQAVGESVHRDYLAARGSGCFDAKLLANILSNPSIDQPPLLPACWTATFPPMLHTYPAFYKPRYGSRTIIPILSGVLYGTEGAVGQLWADVPIADRLAAHCPPPKLASLVNACVGLLSAASTTGAVNMLQLHGSEYARSSQIAAPTTVAYPRCPWEPSYAVCADGSILAGGIRWFNPALKDARIAGSDNVIQAAIWALRHARGVHTLSFDGVFAVNADSQLQALRMMVEMCRNSDCMRSIAFPFAYELSISSARVAFAEAWKAIGVAMSANPNPKFTSLDFRGSNLDDDGLANLLPGLEFLFGPAHNGLRPVSLKLDSNGLMPGGVTQLCSFLAHVPDLSHFEELSLAGNPWATAGSTAAVLEVVKKAPVLRVLNLESKARPFVNIRLLQAALIASPCPLEVLALGGSPVPPEEVSEWEQAIVAIAQAKISTLKKISLRGAALDATFACRIISALPAVEVDLSDGGVSSLHPGTQLCIDRQALVPVLRLSNNPWPGLQMWAALPRHIVDLDLSEAQGAGGVLMHCLFDPLLNAFQTLRYNVALVRLNVARNIAGNFEGFEAFLQAALGNAFFQLQYLNITGCRGGAPALACLGRCLRSNRSLTALHFDGQAPPGLTMNDVGNMAEGWKAFRHCLYGNKKIVELSYPWADVSQYFHAVAWVVQRGWNEAEAIRRTIGAAHRRHRWDEKSARIRDITVCMIAFKAVERVRTRSVRTLHEMFLSVQSNVQHAHAMQQMRMESKRNDPAAEVAREIFAAREFGYLHTLHAPLLQLACSRAKHLAFRTVPPNGVPILNPHQEEVSWRELSALFAGGTLLFTAHRYERLVMLVESVEGRQILQIDRTLQTMGRFIERAAKKGATMGRAPEEFALDIDKSSPGLLDQFKTANFWGEAQAYVASIRAARRARLGQVSAAPAISGSACALPVDGPSDTPVVVAQPLRVGDYAVVANADYDDNHGIPDAVDLYAGAGPRDLPDGGDNHDRSIDKVASGGRAGRNGGKKKDNAGSAPHSGPTVAQIAKDLNRQWQSAIDGAVEKCTAVLLNPLEYKVTSPYLTTKVPCASHCTLVTQCSVDRLDKLERLVRGWGGALSVAVYVSTYKKVQPVALTALHDLVQRLDADVSFQGHLAVSVLFGHEDSPWLWDCSVPGGADGPLYPINALRNLAAAAVLNPQGDCPASPLVFLVDVDFAPSAGLGEWVQNNAVSALLPRCVCGDLVVVPAFECDEALSAYLAHPSVDFVREGVASGSITGFHVSHFPAGHSPSDYNRWQDLSASSVSPQHQQEMYEVPYSDYYEPYVIMSTERFVPYDERFRGYGLNKCIHLRALAERGCSFHVLPDHFVVAEGHAKSVAHQRTYGSQSGYRKHVVAAAYRAALRDIKAGVPAVVSGTTQRLLAGTELPGKVEGHKARVNEDKLATGRVSSLVRRVGKELKDSITRMLQQSKEAMLVGPTTVAIDAVW